MGKSGWAGDWANRGAARVDDFKSKLTRSYFRHLARLLIKLRRPIVIGITGSVGKTTTVDMVAGLLMRADVRPFLPSADKTRRNMNNYLGSPALGFPLTVLGHRDWVRGRRQLLIALITAPFRAVFRGFFGPKILVLEYGTGTRRGVIARLADIAPPSIGIVTSIGPAHLAGLGTIKDVANEKSALVRVLPASGLAIFGDENPHLSEMVATTAAPVKVVPGRGNELAANVTREVGNFFKIPADIVERAIAEFQQPYHRLAVNETDGLTIIDDTYNANPLSMRLALEVLSREARPQQRRIAVLGTMAELGTEEAFYHQEIGASARQHADLVIGVGEPAKGYGADQWFPDARTCAAVLPTLLQKGDRVLIKGSRSVRMETVVDALIVPGPEAGSVSRRPRPAPKGNNLTFRLRSFALGALSVHPRPPSISARAACLMDATTGDILCAKNADVRLPLASIVKLASAIILVRRKEHDLDAQVRIDQSDLERGSSMGLVAGDVVTFRDLLYGMLLPSGNDAACAVARAIGTELLKEEDRPGDPSSRFVAEMNHIVAELGLRRTHFQNPHGRDSREQHSCARDIALLAKEAFTRPAIVHAASTRTYRFDLQGDYPRSAQVQSTNELLEEDGILAGKTGSTRNAGGCLVVLAVAKQRRVIGVVLGSRVSFDHKGMVVPSSDRRYADIRKVLTGIA